MAVPSDPEVLPPFVSVDQVKLEVEGIYACPGCQVEKTVPASGIGWVRCPIYNEAYICAGCCIDIASVSRDPEMEDNPFRSLLAETASQTRQNQASVRRACLEHQVKILEAKLSDPGLPSEWRRARNDQFASILNILGELRNR